MTTLNADLLRAALADIEAYPEQWEPQAWAARSHTGNETYSLAARICLRAGLSIDWTRCNEWGAATWLTDRRTIPDAARELLGLHLLDAYKLFDVENDVAKSRKVAERMIKRYQAGR